MSGHSKWSQIKHKKGVTDQKRGALFSKLLMAISVAARDNPDPEFNAKLRAAIERARDAQVPKGNIERAVKKSSEVENVHEFMFEAYGPEKSAIIIDGLTDNKNRTVAEIKKLLSDNQAKLADPGSVLWAFTREDEAWKPQFDQSVSEDAMEKISSLVTLLEEHPDVGNVITNVNL